ILDNATNNDTAVGVLGDKYSFCAVYRQLRYSCHILNLSTQVVIWGKDRDLFKNSVENLAVR
ncbi:hypothetical protein K469DRAFT_471344, partial [Zopfia rhizophila CBS 207.26]